MVSVARKNLFQDKVRLLIAVGGVAFATLLVLVLFSLYQGWRSRIGYYINQTPAQIWVAQAGATDMFHSVSVVPAEARSSLEKVAGVAEVHPLLGRQVSFQLKGGEVHTYLIGFHPEGNVGGPVKMVAGSAAPRDGEIVVDRVFARNNGLAVGDTLDIGEHRLRIAGISEGGNMIIYQFSFVNYPLAQEMLRLKDMVNFFLVKLSPEAQPEQVAAEIERRLPGTTALSSREFLANNRKIIEDSFLPIIVALVFIGFFIGAVVIGLTTYTATVEKSREYGVLKAVGASNGYLYRVVFEQSLIAGGLGFLAGVLLTLGVNRLAESLVPAFTTSLEGGGIALAGVLVGLMGLVASYIPVRRLARLDPMIVFRA